jgi:hypothetical protein
MAVCGRGMAVYVGGVAAVGNGVEWTGRDVDGRGETTVRRLAGRLCTSIA